MHFIYFALFCIFISISYGEDLEKYVGLRERCANDPLDSGCLEVKMKFFQIIQKCQLITTQQQFLVCQQVKEKLCSIFPNVCVQIGVEITTTKKPTTKSTSTKKVTTTTTQSTSTKKITTANQNPSTTRKRTKPKPKVTTPSPSSSTTTTTKIANVVTSPTLTNEEFIQVPVDPTELRTRGEYCIRHGKEKKCQQLLNNLKNTYSSCSKKKPTTTPTKPEQIDCHSFQTHLCKAFPKFPPCIKKTSN